MSEGYIYALVPNDGRHVLPDASLNMSPVCSVNDVVKCSTYFYHHYEAVHKCNLRSLSEYM